MSRSRRSSFEMFGHDRRTRCEYVYLSDGGHFENLGLYEMIRRRCRCIVVSDAGCDPAYGFEDLGNAVRKIAIDLGVYISFDKLHELRARSKDGTMIKGAYYAVGDDRLQDRTGMESMLTGSRAENGYILYMKPGYHGTEGAGIVAYAKASTAHFRTRRRATSSSSESQFESYRTLGFEIAQAVFNAREGKDEGDDEQGLTLRSEDLR